MTTMKVMKNSKVELALDETNSICIDHQAPFVGKVEIKVKRSARDGVVISLLIDGVEYL